MKKSRSKRWLSAALASAMLMGSGVSQACTSFLLPGSDGGFVYGRTLEFGMDIESKGIAIPRNLVMKGTGIDGKAGSGLAWTTKYAAFGANGVGLPIIVDGMNEKGLAGGMLYAPGISTFQEVSPAESNQSIASYELLVYALTNFATVDEVKEGLRKIKVNQSPQKAFKGVVPLHFTLHDASGKSIVVEYIGGQLQMTDNPTSVLTNAPQFSFHLTNIGNYTDLSTTEPAPLKMGDASFSAPSSGGGMTGLPGDFSSPSRFIRAFFMTKNVPTKFTTEQQVATAFHFLNNFDLPPGMISLGGGGFGGGGGGYEITYFSAVSDLKNMIFYIRTHNNPSVQAIEMNKLDLDAKEIRYFDFNNPWQVYKLTGN
jgi:choloylglycine hydrolase